MIISREGIFAADGRLVGRSASVQTALQTPLGKGSRKKKFFLLMAVP